MRIHTAVHLRTHLNWTNSQSILWTLKSLWLVLTLRSGCFTVSGLVEGSGSSVGLGFGSGCCHGKVPPHIGYSTSVCAGVCM